MWPMQTRIFNSFEGEVATESYSILSLSKAAASLAWVELVEHAWHTRRIWLEYSHIRRPLQSKLRAVRTASLLSSVPIATVASQLKNWLASQAVSILLALTSFHIKQGVCSPADAVLWNRRQRKIIHLHLCSRWLCHQITHATDWTCFLYQRHGIDGLSK